MAYWQNEETGICCETFFSTKPPSKRSIEITQRQYIEWLEGAKNTEQANQPDHIPDVEKKV